MIICSQCGSTVEDSERFCTECGTSVPTMAATQATTSVSQPPQPVQTQPQQPAYSAPVAGAPAFGLGAAAASQVAPASAQAATSSTPKLILGVVAGVFVLGAIIAIAIIAGGNSVEKKLDEAIAKKNLFGPAKDNAYDLYNQLKNGGASAQILRLYGERLTPLLTESGLRLIKDFPTVGYDEPDVNVWQQEARKLNWAAELNPDSTLITSRATYCNARVAYLQKEFDRALPLYTRAASLDKNWALPVNGVGLIYLDRKAYSNARRSFSDAINREEDWPVPYSNMGSTYYQEKNFVSAKEFFNKALAKAPNWARPHMHLGNIAIEEGDYPTAVSEFETALNSNMIGLKNNDFKITSDGLERARKRMQGY